VNEALKTQIGNFQEKEYDSIGPVIGQELKQKALYQLILVSIGIIFYIAYAFRRVARPVTPWQFGIAAVIALLHDLLIVLGIFSFLGHYHGIEIDSLFVTAMLTVLGFSVHDTIVVFDRIRENLKIYAGQSIDFVVNHNFSPLSINFAMKKTFPKIRLSKPSKLQFALPTAKITAIKSKIST
jgi:preprotein translocase subunit SecF